MNASNKTARPQVVVRRFVRVPDVGAPGCFVEVEHVRLSPRGRWVPADQAPASGATSADRRRWLDAAIDAASGR